MNQEEQDIIDYNLNLRLLDNNWRLDYKRYHDEKERNKNEDQFEDFSLPTNMHIE